MSRVIKKLADGGTSEQKRLFEWAGNQYDADALQNAYIKRYQDEINSGKYSKRELELLDKGFNKVLTALKDPSFKRNANGSWYNEEGISSSGNMNKNIIGRLKKTDDNSVSLAASILNDAFSTMSPYSKPSTEDKKSLFDLNLRNRLTKRLMPGEKGWNQNIWIDLEKGQRGNDDKLLTTGRQQAIREELLKLAEDVENPENRNKYQYQDFIKDPSEYARQIRELVGDGQNKGLLGDIIGDAGDLATLSKLGITGFEGLLQDAIEQADPNAPEGETPEQRKERLRIEQNNKEWNDFVSQTKQGDQSKQWGIKLGQTLDQILPKKPDSQKNPVELFQAVIPAVSLNTSTPNNPIPVNIPLNRSGVENRPSDRTGMASLRKNIEDWIFENPDKVKELTDGEYIYLPTTISDDGRYIVRYRKKDNLAQRVLLTESQKALDWFKKNIFDRSKNPNIANRTGEFKEGGVIKYQFGGYIDEALRESSATREYTKKQEEQKLQEEARVKAQVQARRVDNQPKKEDSEGSRKPVDGLEWDDYARLGAIGSDLVGLIAGFVPAGSVVSAGSGFLSTGANFAADMKDGFQLSDAGSALASLGLDVLSVIPGLGLGAKAGKITKSLVKYAPYLMTAWSASENTGPALESLSKLVKGSWKDLTVDDWRNISTGLHLLVSGGRGIARGIKAGQLDSQLRTGNKQIETNKGTVTLTPGQYEALKKTKGIEGANEYLKEQKIDGEVESAFRAWYNPAKYVSPRPVVSNEYDFSRYTPRYETAKTKVIKDPETGKQKVINLPDKRAASTSDRIVANMQTNSILKAGRNTLSPKSPGPVKQNTSSPKASNSEVSKNTKKYESVIQTGKPNMALIRKKYPRYSNLTDEELLEQVKDKINPASYNSAKEEIAIEKENAKPKPKRKPPVRKKKPTTSAAEEQEAWRRSIHEEYKNGGVFRLQSGGRINTGLSGNPIKLNIDRQSVLNNMWSAFSRDNPNASYQDFINSVVNPYNESYNRMMSSRSPEAIRAHQQMTFDNPYLREIHNATVEALYNQYRQQGYTDEQIEAKLGNKNSLNIDGLLGSRTIEYNLLGDYRNPDISKPIQTIPLAPTKLTQPVQSMSLAPMSTQQSNSTPNVGEMNGFKATRSRNGFQFLPEDAIALGRMVGTVGVNNWANRRIQSALRPTLIDTYENYIPQTEDYLAKTSAHNQAAELQRQAGRVAAGTSDASLGAAALLEATRQGRQFVLQGDMANSQRLYQTGEQGRAESNAAKARRVEVANRNKAAMNQVDLAKAQMDAQTRVGNWMQAIQPWAAGIENRLRTNRATQRQLDLRANELGAQQNYYISRQNLINAYKDKDLSDPAIQAEFQNEQMRLENEAARKALDNTATTIGKGVWMKRPLTPNSLFARGGRLTAKDTALIERAKDFNKTMREQQKNFLRELQSIRRENGQMMRQLSSFTASLIKSGMSWK